MITLSKCYQFQNQIGIFEETYDRTKRKEGDPNVSDDAPGTTLSVSDGDSIYCDDELLRILGDGTPHETDVDTPELRTYKCKAEAVAAQSARDRMRELISVDGVRVEDSGERDRTQTRRRLVRVWVPTPTGKRTAGSILLEEGHARHWIKGQKVDWC